MRTTHHANRHATTSGHPAHSRPGVHAGEIPIRPRSPGTHARLAVRDQEEQIPGERRPAGSVLRAGGQIAASRMAGQCVYICTYGIVLYYNIVGGRIVKERDAAGLSTPSIFFRICTFLRYDGWYRMKIY